MRKLVLAAALLCLCLTGCGRNIPTRTVDGAAWDESWVDVGGILGVETPEGIDLRENSDTLSPQGMYYATWSIGEAEPYTNADGEEAELYDAQIYVLLAGHDASEKAEDTADEWLEMARERYQVAGESTETYNGQEFSVVECTFDSETNPFARGASAFGVYRNYAVSVELSCREDLEGDPKEILADFLEHCHYAA